MTAATFAAALLALLPVPPLTGPVVDEAGLVQPPERARLEWLLRSARAEQGGQGVQLQILTVPALDGEPIEDFSIRVAEAWKIGTKGKDNGLLLVISRDDHRYRLEVGGGLEGDLTDAQARHLLDENLQPAFRAGQYGRGVEATAVAALRAVGALPAAAQGSASPAPEATANQDGQPPPQHHPLKQLLIDFAFIAFILLWVLFTPRRRSYGGGWSSGGGGWSSGGGGGGWSGGGGGFSGGGASGGW